MPQRGAQYIATIHAFEGGRAFSSEPLTELFDFVRSAIRALEIARPESLTKGLFRVDVFQLATGRMVVNEFESLEAAFCSSAENTLKVQHFLLDYWYDLLKGIVTNARAVKL